MNTGCYAPMTGGGAASGVTTSKAWRRRRVDMNTPARLVRYEETVGGYGAWIAWRHSDRAVFMAVVAAIRQRIPSDGRVYAPTSKAWCIDKDELPKLYDVLPELRERLHGAQPARPLWHERPAVPPAVAADLNELYVVPGAPWLIVP